MSPAEVAHRLRLEREFLESLEQPLGVAGIRALCARLGDMEAALMGKKPEESGPPADLDTILTEDDDHVTLDTMTTGTDVGTAISAGHRAGRPRERTIRLLLQRTGLGSIAQVARAIGVTPSMMSRVVAGEKRLGAEKATALKALIDSRKVEKNVG